MKVVPIPIADVKHAGPVDFQNRSASGAAAQLHRLPQQREGGKSFGAGNAAVDPQRGRKRRRPSCRSKAATACCCEPPLISTIRRCRPPDNNVKAVALTSNELGLIKLWIDQGATGQVATTRRSRSIGKRLPSTVRPILAVAVSPDGELAACGRDNEIYVYGINSGATVARLVDPALAGQSGGGGPGVAHLDLVQSLAFQPSGDLLASGGFREVKLWQRPHNVRLGTLSGAAGR